MWYAVVDAKTNRAVSFGTVLAKALPDGLKAVEIDGPPGDRMWDEATAKFVDRPVPVLIDRLQDLISDARYAGDFATAYAALNATQKTNLRNGLIRFLGRLRYREQSEPVEVG